MPGEARAIDGPLPSRSVLDRGLKAELVAIARRWGVASGGSEKTVRARLLEHAQERVKALAPRLEAGDPAAVEQAVLLANLGFGNPLAGAWRARAEAEPGSAVAWFQMARDLSDGGDTFWATVGFEKAASLGVPTAILGKALAQFRSGRREEALRACAEAAGDVRGPLLEADLRRAAGDLDGALRCLDLLLQAYPAASEAWNAKGAWLAEADRWEAAVGCFGSASSSPHAAALAHNNKAAVLLAAGDLTEALAQWEAAVAARPPPVVWANYAVALGAAGRFREARAALRKAQEGIDRADYQDRWRALGVAERARRKRTHRPPRKAAARKGTRRKAKRRPSRR